MSDKRFRVCCDDDLGDMWVVDIDTDEEYWTAPSLVDLLNNLHDEVTDLNKANKMLKLQTYCQDQYIKKLELEQKALLEQLETQNI